MAEKRNGPGFTDMMKQAQGVLAAGPMLAPQMEQAWKAQDGLLEEAEAFTKGWYERRHEAAQSALDTVRQMNGGADPAGAMQALAEWQRHSLERMAEDVQQWMDMCTRCAGHLASAEKKAAERTLEEASRQAASAASKA